MKETKMMTKKYAMRRKILVDNRKNKHNISKKKKPHKKHGRLFLLSQSFYSFLAFSFLIFFSVNASENCATANL